MDTLIRSLGFLRRTIYVANRVQMLLLGGKRTLEIASSTELFPLD